MYKYYIKRLLDFFICMIILFVISPVFSVIIVLILVTEGNPIFFIQIRPGRREKLFGILKFRTMLDSNDEIGNLLPDKNRITRLGAFLRKTSLDELPELFNVVKGEMSLVGPRPLLEKYLPYYTEREKTRHNVRPGITGLAQISGRNLVNWDDRLELDAVYVENISFLLDMKILFKTFFVVLNSRGVSVNTAEVEPSLIDYRNKTLIENI